MTRYRSTDIRAVKSLANYKHNRRLVKEQIKKVVGSIPNMDKLIDLLENDDFILKSKIFIPDEINLTTGEF